MEVLGIVLGGEYGACSQNIWMLRLAFADAERADAWLM